MLAYIEGGGEQEADHQIVYRRERDDLPDDLGSRELEVYTCARVQGRARGTGWAKERLSHQDHRKVEETR